MVFIKTHKKIVMITTNRVTLAQLSILQLI
jgi:hypothetical protein